MDNSKFKIYLAIAWLVVTASLLLWWMYFSMSLVESESHKNMLFLEGITFMLLLIIGGGTLILLISKEEKRVVTLKNFFAAFSHEMKTAIASLRLQTESLQQDLRSNSESSPILNRLVADTSRILVATENSLYLAQAEDSKLFNETVEVHSVIESMAASWPQIQLNVQGQASVSADRRAFKSIFDNLVYNSLSHGNATEISIIINKLDSYCKIVFQDNGKGFKGDMDKLGNAFVRHNNTSSSGLGLSIVKSFISKMGGAGPQFESNDKGFKVSFQLPVESA